jgi:hypothetical protein
MGRKIIIALLALGAVAGFGAGFARLFHGCHPQKSGPEQSKNLELGARTRHDDPRREGLPAGAGRLRPTLA